MRNSDMPAFAQPNTYHENGQVEIGHVGLSKKEFFAGLAMQGLLASGAGVGEHTAERARIAAVNLLEKLEPR